MFDWVHYQFPSRVYFEVESTHKIGSMVRDIGSRVLLVSIRDENTNPDQLMVIKTSLEKFTSGAILYDDIETTPGYEELDTAVHFVKQCNADVIMAFGSRNSMNAAKAIALLCRNEIFAEDLINATLPLKNPPLPLITVPAMPIMGEESSPAFLIHDPEKKSCYQIIDTRLFPALIFSDPAITTTVSNNEIAICGVSVLAACIETILGKRSNEITNSIALKGLELITHNLISLVKDPSNTAARLNVCQASVLCGMAHSNSQLGLCYVLATVLHNRTGIDFFMLIAILLPHTMEYNLTISAGKYVQIARALDEEITEITVIEAAIKAVEGVRKIYLELKIPQRLSDFEVNKSELPAIAEEAIKMPMIHNNPRELDKNEIETILSAAF